MRSGLRSSLLMCAGVITYALALFHAAFWRVFGWDADLAKLTLENRAIMQTLNVCLIYLLLAIATVSVFGRKELVESRLGRLVSASVAGFWVIRLVAQVVFFGFGGPISYAMSASFVAMAVPYALALAPAQLDRQQHRDGVASEREH